MGLKSAQARAAVLVREGRTTPGRVRSLTLIAVLAISCLGVIGSVAIGNARQGLKVIGHGAGPQVVATSDLYYALSDMNAQVANVLLSDWSTDLGLARKQAIARYEKDRAQVSRAVMQAASLAGDNSVQRATLHQVLNQLGTYEALAAEAMVLDAQAKNKSFGVSPKKAIEAYREATKLLKNELLPAAAKVTQESDATVRATYQAAHSNVRSLPLWIGLAGLWVIVVLLAMQVFLSVRFRRILSPALIAATVGTFALVIVSLLVLRATDENLEVATNEGHDKILAVSQSRGMNNTLQADEATYRLEMRNNIGDKKLRTDIEERMGTFVDGFRSTDATMVAVIKDHQKVFDNSIARGDQYMAGWHFIFPGTAAGIALLVLVGARTRLKEYS